MAATQPSGCQTGVAAAPEMAANARQGSFLPFKSYLVPESVNAQEEKMMKETSTVFKIRLLAKGDPKKQEGFIELWKHKGKIMEQQKPFDFLDEIPP
jgi:hypothetical protein